jgi:hypothetical protein
MAIKKYTIRKKHNRKTKIHRGGSWGRMKSKFTRKPFNAPAYQKKIEGLDVLKLHKKYATTFKEFSTFAQTKVASNLKKNPYSTVLNLHSVDNGTRAHSADMLLKKLPQMTVTFNDIPKFIKKITVNHKKKIIILNEMIKLQEQVNAEQARKNKSTPPELSEHLANIKMLAFHLNPQGDSTNI